MHPDRPNLTQQFAKDTAALSGVFDFLTAAAAELAVPDDVLAVLQLVVEEVFMNFVRYNTESHNDVTIQLERRGAELRVALIDHDVHSYDLTKREPVDITRPIEERQPGGLGIHLIRSLMDDVIYEYADRSCKITLIKRLGAEHADN